MRLYWTETAFIFGVGYDKKNAKQQQLLNFVTGQAKLSIYKSRRNQKVSQVISMFKSLVKVRVRVDYSFFSLMDNVNLCL